MEIRNALDANLVRRLLPFAGRSLRGNPVGGALGPGAHGGQEYARIKNPLPVEAGSKIEVIEFFSYGCPHCADLEPVMQGWMKTIPSDVAFVRVPVMFQDRWVVLAKIYYTLDALGVEQRLSPEVFVAIHKSGANLSSEKTFFDWAESKGLDRKKVEDMYNSFAIAGKMNRAKAQAQHVQHPVGADDRRRRQVRRPQPTRWARTRRCRRRSTRWSPRRAPSARNPDRGARGRRAATAVVAAA